ncbi:MAG: EAL domain-containing protein [Firmicutes bacterium]|jgi:EAL domain-containing protein (putative c-di-GMP-specific phosphodiesterase class I)|nr:EAL domain-containing protein [Bacillota bacterium]
MIKKWCTAVFITVAILVTVLSIYTYKFNYINRIEEYENTLISMSHTAKTQFDTTFAPVIEETNGVINKIIEESMAENESRLVRKYPKASQYIDEAFLVVQENLFDIKDMISLDDYERLFKFMEGPGDEESITTIKNIENDNLFYIVNGFMDEGKFKVLLTGINMTKVSAVAKPENFNAYSSYVYIISKDGYIISHPDKNINGLNVFYDSNKLMKILEIEKEAYQKVVKSKERFTADTKVKEINYKSNGHLRKAYYSKLEGVNFYIYMSSDYSSFRKNAIMETFRTLLPLMICLMICLITLYVYIFVLQNTDYSSEIKNNYAFSKYLKKAYKKGKREYYFVIRIDNIICKEDEYVFDDNVMLKVSDFFKSLDNYYLDIYRISRLHYIFVVEDLSNIEFLLEKIKMGIKRKSDNLEIRGKTLLLTMDSLDPDLNVSDMDDKILHQMNDEYVNISDQSSSKCIQYNEIFDKFNSHIKDKSYVEKMIMNENIIPFFQPIVNLTTNEVIKHEVLMRVDDKDNFINTFKIIEIAEKEGLVEKIDRSIIAQSFHMYKTMFKESGKRVPLSINLSSKSINGKLIDYIMKCVDQYDVIPEDITFELTETATSDDLDATLYYLKTLRSRGFKIAIDDFGTGYAHVELLSKVDVDYIKIDGVFVMNASNDKKKLKTLNALVYLAKNYDTEIIAEFIEDQQTIDILKRLNVEFGQGYYFGKPDRELVG